eukprot:3591671-Amphidinium_carterae.1
MLHLLCKPSWLAMFRSGCVQVVEEEEVVIDTTLQASSHCVDLLLRQGLQPSITAPKVSLHKISPVIV